MGNDCAMRDKSDYMTFAFKVLETGWKRNHFWSQSQDNTWNFQCTAFLPSDNGIWDFNDQ